MDSIRLTPQRRAVVVGLANGRSNGEIGLDLKIKTETVKTYLQIIFKDFGMRDRAGVVSIALRLGLIRMEDVVLPGECPGAEQVPNYCRCLCEGCKHHCGAHHSNGES